CARRRSACHCPEFRRCLACRAPPDAQPVGITAGGKRSLRGSQKAWRVPRFAHWEAPGVRAHGPFCADTWFCGGARGIALAMGRRMRKLGWLLALILSLGSLGTLGACGGDPSPSCDESVEGAGSGKQGDYCMHNSDCCSNRCNGETFMCS